MRVAKPIKDERKRIGSEKRRFIYWTDLGLFARRFERASFTHVRSQRTTGPKFVPLEYTEYFRRASPRVYRLFLRSRADRDREDTNVRCLAFSVTVDLASVKIAA